MPKYYCDYCDTFLTHDSASVRKSHMEGTRHQAAVRAYYAQLDSEYKDTPDRETMRYEKMKDDAIQFMLMGPPMMAMGGYPPMMPPAANFGGGYPPYGPPSTTSSAPPPKYESQGFNKRDGGWDDRRTAPRSDGRGPQAGDGYRRTNDDRRGGNNQYGNNGSNGNNSGGYGNNNHGGGGYSAPSSSQPASSSAPSSSNYSAPPSQNWR